MAEPPEGPAGNPPPGRRLRPDGQRTRQAIVREAVSLATLDGLEGLSIGNLARATKMSKSGLYAHFGSKEELQLATVDEAARIFEEEVVAPALAAEAGIEQLLAVCEAFFDHLRRRTFPGGCFFASAALEMGTRSGPVKEKVAAFQAGFVGLLRQFASEAITRGQLDATESPEKLAFELSGVILAADVNFVLSGSGDGLELARQVVRARLLAEDTRGRQDPTYRVGP